MARVHILILRGLSVAAVFVVSAFLYSGWFSLWTVGVWVLALLPWTFEGPPSQTTHVASFWQRMTIFTVLMLPCAVRIILMDRAAFHGDTFIPGYFSLHYEPAVHNFFGPFPDPPLWVAQFPVPFFAIQKALLQIFGGSVLGLRLSILPYVFLESLGVFWAARALFDQRAAFVAVLFYAFFAPSLYLETEGFHLVSSAGVFVPLLGYLVQSICFPARFRAGITGLMVGACYLFHHSAYIALPVLGVFLIIRSRQVRWNELWRDLCGITLALIVVLTPFYAAIANQESLYFLRRINQVSVIDQIKEATDAGAPSPVMKFLNHTMDAFRSFYEPSIAGNGGYNFGHKALFESVAKILFPIGVLIGLCDSRRRKPYLLISSSIGIAFVLGVLMTTSPPALHRLSVIFPFFAMLCAVPVITVAKRAQRWKGASGALLVCMLLVWAANNVRTEFDMKAAEFASTWEIQNDIRLSRYIVEQFPHHKIYVAAYPGFGFENLFYFFDPDKRAVVTSYHDLLIQKFSPAEKYLYIIHDPHIGNSKGEYWKQFQESDPSGSMDSSDTWRRYYLFHN